MKINYTNRVKLELRKILDSAAQFYVDKLDISEKIQENLLINVFVRKGPDRGACYVNCYPKRLPTEFDIELYPCELSEMLSSFAHEMIHVKQFATGELRVLPKCSKWNNQIWQAGSDELDNYYDSPWEIEAYGREEGLYVRFATSHSELIEEWNDGQEAS